MTITQVSHNPNQHGKNLTFATEEDITMNPTSINPGFEIWEETFQQLFERAVDSFKSGVRDSEQMFSYEDKLFLESIGATPQEIFDFVEDWTEDGVPTPEIIREITGLRREYFFTVQDGKLESEKMISDDLPSPWASLGEHQWLPRLIAKARAKLCGELPPHIMYGCGRDRPFLEERNIGLSEFLRKVWEFGADEKKILSYVNQMTEGRNGA